MRFPPLTVLSRALTAAFALASTACGPSTGPPYAIARWFAADETTTIDALYGPTTAHIGGASFAAAVYDNWPVFAGDMVEGRARIVGPMGRHARFVLQRHCDAQRGSDADSTIVELTGAPQDIVMRHTFSTYYSCIRLSFLRTDGEPLDLEVLSTDVVLIEEP